jgi:hypothetical protein
MNIFLNYIKEATDTKKGNYVSLGVSSMPKIEIEPKTGKISKEFHVTLMYSKESTRNPNTIKRNVEKKFPNKIETKISHASGFDSEEDGVTCIVLELEDSGLSKIHEYLKMEGLKHSYNDFKPHLTLFYDVNTDEAKSLIEKLNASDVIGKTVILSGFDSTTVKEDWNE